ncbi:MAG: hypothetical protein ACI819_001002 [Neolewinella sp.]|jgi:hypothetical protein
MVCAGSEAFVFALPDVSEVLPVWSRSTFFVEENGHVQHCSNTFTQHLRARHQIHHLHAANGHERANIHRPDARMFSFMLPHIDPLRRYLIYMVGRFEDRIGIAGKGKYRPVRPRARILVQ